MRKERRISKEQALSFLLTYLVVEKQVKLELDPQVLFKLNYLSSVAEETINKEEGIIPHEVIEELAQEILTSL